MAHYAFLGENNIVTEVIVGIDETELIEGKDPETWYGEFRGQTCKRTSYNTRGGEHLLGGTPFRGNYASIGSYYDEERDIFIPPKPFSSWVFNYDSLVWESPIPYPNDGGVYEWSEEDSQWIQVSE